MKGTIRVPAKIVGQAMEKRDVGVVNATGADGAPIGARLVGVNKYKSGLKDGDVITQVGSTRVLSVDTLVLVGMSLASSSAKEVTGRILRGTQVYAVVLEIPR
ncbi:MAG: hypothetical protein JWP97_1305 [Labilithrix sp.]|nr:hypothetical protein [Labilithrix sp.]